MMNKTSKLIEPGLGAAPVITEEYIAKRISLNIKGSVRFLSS